ncbi:alpha/beta hydrolase [Gemella cuniculi]|uniref:alpha/beta hydrolase n=1 Tax=Gemella cuniculi TaxID=150240 RepID=UPI0004087504|nr:alpha/beta hydrolase-fold protein [Gemella cuniculi]
MKKQVLIASALGLSIILGACSSVTTTQNSQVSQNQEMMSNSLSKVETLNYSINYEGKNYDKNVLVYVPEQYKQGEKIDVLYLMHGSTGSGEELANALKPLLDTWIREGKIKPMLVAFPTYYPDRSFVTSNYSRDYPLNNFFATEEIDKVIERVETNYTTFAENSSVNALRESRKHRTFGGYSMGSVTTWDILVNKSDYFYYYMPMAGDSWIGRSTNMSSDEVSDKLTSGLRANNYNAEDFKIIAMVGERDGTKSSMIPQINALRNKHNDLINSSNLIYWENDNGGHDLNSLLVEVEYGSQMLFKE